MRRIIKALIVVLSMLLLAGAAVLLVHHFIHQQAGAQHGSTGPSIEQIRMLQHLVTAKVAVTDVMTTTVTGHTGSMDVVIAVKGELSVGVDLASARLIDVDETRRHAVLVLPNPTLLDAHIDHSRSRVIAIPSRGLWQVLPADPAVDARVIDTAYAAAQHQLEAAHLSEATLEAARSQAQKVLGDFAHPLGWTLEVRWQSGRRRSCGPTAAGPAAEGVFLVIGRYARRQCPERSALAEVGDRLAGSTTLQANRYDITATVTLASGENDPSYGKDTGESGFRGRPTGTACESSGLA